MTYRNGLAASLPVVISMCCLAGCASYQAVPDISNPLGRAHLAADAAQQAAIERSLTDTEIAKLLDANIHARLPSPLALAKVRSECWSYQSAIETIDVREMQGWQRTVAGLRGLEEVIPISHLAVKSDKLNLHELRQAAARQGCELLLVYVQADAGASNYNDAAVLYWTIAGLWLVPGHTVEHKTVMQAVLLDCRTGMILGTATGDCGLKENATAAAEGIKRAQFAERAPQKALADLQQACGQMLTRVVAAANRTASAGPNNY